ncbi:MAG: hypothetical protein PHR77_03280 [Kiritimatiellae bacterium]|nr:hypothetical protein [Kiritimatiellia bacterium]MDD5519580.1 hypothetical protein [Kiritimatiellia bacterium]
MKEYENISGERPGVFQGNGCRLQEGVAGLLYFPGNETFARILTCVTVILCEIAVYYFILYCLHHWVPGKKRPVLMFGRLAGTLLSLILAGPIFTVTFLKYFSFDDNATSAVLVFFIILSLVLVFAIYRQPTGGPHGSSQ